MKVCQLGSNIFIFRNAKMICLDGGSPKRSSSRLFILKLMALSRFGSNETFKVTKFLNIVWTSIFFTCLYLVFRGASAQNPSTSTKARDWRAHSYMPNTEQTLKKKKVKNSLKNEIMQFVNNITESTKDERSKTKRKERLVINLHW